MEASEFKQTFLPHSLRMYQEAWRLTGNTLAAEDLVQDAFMKLWLKRNSLGEIKNAEAYCVILVRHILYDEKRRCRLKVSENSADEYSIAADIETDKDIEHRDESSKLMILIEKLPEQQREVITMRDVYELSYDEIEDRTGITNANIRVLLSRARKKIREQFKKILNYERI